MEQLANEDLLRKRRTRGGPVGTLPPPPLPPPTMALESQGMFPFTNFNCLMERIDSSHTEFPFLNKNALESWLESHPL